MNVMYIGIDIGTSYSSAALLVNGVMQLVREPLNHTSMFPSSVYVTDDGDVLVGQAAENQYRVNPDRYQREFKRDLGVKEPYILGSRLLLPADLIAAVIRMLKQEAETMLSQRLNRVVLSVPASYGGYRKGLMEQAAQSAGFARVDLLVEPIAAALAYDYQTNDTSQGHVPGNTLVYDLGGGTFNATLIAWRDTSYDILGRERLDSCGGIDFDRAIYQYVRDHLSSETRDLIDRNDLVGIRARFILENWCRTIKHQLSTAPQVEDFLPLSPALSETYRFTRALFEELIRSLVQSTIVCCEQLVRNTGIKPDEVDKVLLVGGSSRILYIGEQIAAQFGWPVVRVSDPELAICQGAAVYGSTLEPPGGPGKPPEPPSHAEPTRPGYTISADPWKRRKRPT